MVRAMTGFGKTVVQQLVRQTASVAIDVYCHAYKLLILTDACKYV